MRGTDAEGDFVAARFGLGGGEAGRDAEARGGGGDLRDGRFRRIVIHERDGKFTKFGLVPKRGLQEKIWNGNDGEHQAILTMRWVTCSAGAATICASKVSRR